MVEFSFAFNLFSVLTLEADDGEVPFDPDSCFEGNFIRSEAESTRDVDAKVRNKLSSISFSSCCDADVCVS